MKLNRFVLAVALLGFTATLFTAETSWAQGAAGNAIGFDSGEKNKNPPFPINMFLSISHSVGQGTFLLNPATDATSDHGLENTGILDYTSNPMVSSFGSVTLISKLAALKATLIYNQSFQMEWTQNDMGAATMQPMYFDPATRLLWGGKFMGFMLQYGPGMTIPLSMSSRFAGYQSRVSMRLGALRNFGPWMVNMSITPGASLYLPSAVGQTGEADLYDDVRLKTVNPANCILRENGELANFACNGGTPNLFTFGSRATLFYNGFKNWSLGGAFSANYGWNLYDAPNDGYSPVWRSTEGQVPGEYQLATSDGGRDYTIFTNGGLSATYIIKNFFITVGTSSGQSLWTADAKGWRFPFWDFVSPANNLSSVYVDTSWFF
ncbi:MAG: hypothetical protein CMH56_12325 [Myxococcales bacterium]|nr:hypothetical protein [Myxococcales bacterium]|tara:strand:+ start:8061 stop:9194 length:1134 start_codon:yes stop_codon:yes gene_type:complete